MKLNMSFFAYDMERDYYYFAGILYEMIKASHSKESRSMWKVHIL